VVLPDVPSETVIRIFRGRRVCPEDCFFAFGIENFIGMQYTVPADMVIQAGRKPTEAKSAAEKTIIVFPGEGLRPDIGTGGGIYAVGGSIIFHRPDTVAFVKTAVYHSGFFKNVFPEEYIQGFTTYGTDYFREEYKSGIGIM